MITNEWDEAFLTCFLSALGTAISDHCPLMIDMNMEVCTRRRFKFESFWVKAGDQQVVCRHGFSGPVGGHGDGPSQMFEKKASEPMFS
jgi:hypothetical protein